MISKILVRLILVIVCNSCFSIYSSFSTEMDFRLFSPASQNCAVILLPDQTLGGVFAPQVEITVMDASRLSLGIAHSQDFTEPIVVQQNLRHPVVNITVSPLQVGSSEIGKALLSGRLFFVTAKRKDTRQYVSSRYNALDFNAILAKFTEKCDFNAEPPKRSDVPRLSVIEKFEFRRNRDIYGYDIRLSDGRIGIDSSTIDRCAVNCITSRSCVAFSYDHLLQKCYLKSGINTSILDPASTIAVKKPLTIPNVSSVPSHIRTINRSRFVGEVIGRRKVSNLKSCQTSCEGSLQCVAYNFTTQDRRSENCELFKSVEGHDPTESVSSGYKYQPPP